MPHPESKQCSKCKQTKPLEEFGVSAKGFAGRRPWCHSCVRAYSKARYDNPDLKPRIVATRKRWDDNNKNLISEIQRSKHLRKTFGITVEEYDAMLLKQRSVCAICQKEQTSSFRGKVKNLAVDHCHETGRVRGLLCDDCNQGLGNFKDRKDLLELALAYLLQS